MSILSIPSLQRWYNHSLTERESDTIAFWQAVFAKHFPTEEYLLAPYPSIDPSHMWIDARLCHLVDGGGKAIALLLATTHAFDTARDVEARVLETAGLYFAGLPGVDTADEIFAMTAVGPTFRVWRVSKGEDSLEPLHGDAQRDDKAQYLDAKSEEAGIVFFNLAKQIISRTDCRLFTTEVAHQPASSG